MSLYKSQTNNSAKDVYGKDESATLKSIRDTAESVVNLAKESVSDAYYEGKKKVENVYDVASEQSDHLMKLIKERPFTSILIASGVVFLMYQVMNFNSNNKEQL